MELTFLGLGGAYNTTLNNNFAYLKNGENLLLVDCGENTLGIVRKHNLLKGIKNVFVANTHTHPDHIGGLGMLAFFCHDLGINVFVIANSKTHQKTVEQILTLTGIFNTFYKFITPQQFNLNGLKIEPQRTTHASNLECFGFMFEDENGKYYYTGDSNDFEYVKQLVFDDTVKTIYTECCDMEIPSHMPYEKLKTLPKQKLRLMHFSGNENLLQKAQEDGFILPKNVVLK